MVPMPPGECIASLQFLANCLQASPVAMASPERPKKRKRLVKMGGVLLTYISSFGIPVLCCFLLTSVCMVCVKSRRSIPVHSKALQGGSAEQPKMGACPNGHLPCI